MRCLTEELDLRLAEENRVWGRERDRAVDPEDRNLELVASLDLLGEHDPVWHVEALNRGGTRPPDASRYLTIDPRFSVVVDGEGQHRHCPRGVELPDSCGHRQAGAKPRHEQMTAAAPLEQS